MPYIKKDRREDFRTALEMIRGKTIDSAGEMNYLVSMLCKMYAELNKFDYQAINDIIGALECAKQEYLRRNVAGYEDVKIRENGDI